MNQPKDGGLIGSPPKGGSSISYAGQLREAGLFELHEKVTLKLRVIDALVNVHDRDMLSFDVGPQLFSVIQSVLLDLGIASDEHTELL